LIALFFICLSAATLLPGGSEAFFLYKLNESPKLIYTSLFVATLGNTLGSFINYLLGKYLREFAMKKSYFKQNSITKATKIFEKWGFVSLLLSWTPIIGDPITFVAGVLRYSWWKFLVTVFIAKFIRYGVLMYIYVSMS
jgi:membrane protein YqaA with SNARE-associated domain